MMVVPVTNRIVRARGSQADDLGIHAARTTYGWARVAQHLGEPGVEWRPVAARRGLCQGAGMIRSPFPVSR